MREIEFSGYTWLVEDSGGEKRGPGPNYFSGSSDNVWVDCEGRLHLKMTYQNNQWYCAEVLLDRPLGYGTYDFFLVGRFDLFDPRVVGALFLYRDDTHEMDIEFSLWGRTQGDNLQYVLQPGDLPGNVSRYEVKLNGDFTTHRIVWKPEDVSFRSLHGHYEEPPSNDYIIAEWAYGKAYHEPTTERVDMNLWLVDGQPPMLTQTETEIILTQFSFQPEGT